MKFLGHTGAICSFSLFVLVAAHAFGADPNVTYALVDASDPTKGATTTFEVSSVAGFASAVTTINDWTTDRTVTVDGVTDPVPDSGRFTISLQADITDATGASFEKSGMEVTFLGNGHTLKVKQGVNIALSAWNGAQLNLGRAGEPAASVLTLTTAGRQSNVEEGRGIYLMNGGILTMYDGVVIRDFDTQNTFGGGVAVMNNSLFHMYGGTIEHCGITGGSVCFGGGVAVVYGGQFIMDGGTIKDCYVLGAAGADENNSQHSRSLQCPWTAGGGVFVSYNGSFIMNGGAIEGCNADVADPETSTTSDGVGGGVAVCTSYKAVETKRGYGYLDAEFVMNGGEINGCWARTLGGGIVVGLKYVDGLAFGPLPAWTDGHVARVSLAGDKISNCSAGDGGGVFLMWIRPSIPVTMGAITISGCEAENGGGIEVLSYWTQLTMDGTTVTGNTAAHVAGVLLSGNKDGGTIGTTMKDVSITGNVATDADGVGGIYYDTVSKLTISGAMVVSGNVFGSERKDSNLNCLGHSYPFYVSGSLEGSVIGLTDPLLLAGGADSDVFLSSGYDANNPGVHPYARVFTSDHEGWYADYGDAPDYSAEVRLVKGGATLTGARQRYPWNNFIDFSWTTEGRAGGWLFDFTVEDLEKKDVTVVAALKDAADTTRAAGDAVAGENRVAWDAPADGFARMATNCVVTMKCYRDDAERTAGTPFVTGVISNLAFDTHYDFTTGGYGVRVVADPATDILPITYSATNFVWKGTDVADATGVYGVLANTNEAGAFFDCSSTNLLNSAAGEGAFGWHGNAFDFVKLVHSNELGQTVAYFKFPPLTFTVTQRELEEEGKTDDDAKRSIILSPKWLEDYGIYKVGATDEEVEQLLHDLDTVQPNGCRMWENVVLGNVLTNLLVATVPTMEADALKLALPMTSPAPGYGYKVLYELRRAKVGMVQRDAQHENLHIDLHKDERTDANDPTGLYRIWALVIPDADAAVTNAIPSTNMVGVLKVASTLTNTVTAVPWVALAGDPAVPTNMAAEASLHVANLSAGDQLLAYDAAQRVYYGWTRTAAGSWEPQTTVTERDGVALAAKPENFRLARGSAFWVVRGTPRDGDTAQAAKPYFLYGQHLAGTYEQTLSGGSQENPASSLCANPTPNSVDLNALQFTGSVGNNDTIALNMDGATSTVFVRNKENTEWGRYKKSRVNGYIQSVFVKDGTIPPGRGFWYVRRAEGNLKLTWPGWSEQ